MLGDPNVYLGTCKCILGDILRERKYIIDEFNVFSNETDPNKAVTTFLKKILTG